MTPLMAGEPSAAKGIVHLLRWVVPAWAEVLQPDEVWTFTDPDPDYEGRYVQVVACERQVPTVPEMEGKQVGPTVVAYANGMSLHITLPWVSDGGDAWSALEACVAIDALPPAAVMDARLGVTRPPTDRGRR